MTSLVAHGLDFALALVVLEGLALVLWRRLKGAGPQPLALIANLAAGAALLLLARALVAGAGVVWIGAALTVSLFAHAADLALRWEGRS